MRPSLWLILILSFSAGMCCALAVRHYYFEAKAKPPVHRVRTAEQIVRIIVAKKDIAAGTFITADTVEFQDVPVSELPSEALTDFAKVYRRVPSYPIPAGCPICEDLLRPLEVTGNEQATFIPAGSQLITLQVDQIRHGNSEPLQNMPLSSVLHPGEHIDIRIVPRQESQGKMAEMKNKVLHSYKKTQDLRSEGELVLENVPVHKIASANNSGSADRNNAVGLLLEKNDIEKLTAASRKGLIRIVLGSQQAANVARKEEPAEGQVKTENKEKEQEQYPVPDVPVKMVKTAPEPMDIKDIEQALPPAPLPPETVLIRNELQKEDKPAEKAKEQDTANFGTLPKRSNSVFRFVSPLTRRSLDVEPPAKEEDMTIIHFGSGSFGSGSSVTEEHSPFERHTRTVP
ncbi:MAG: Flp pilus assembly protein CpaB [Planctomycetaceae bacterium]|jgi:Flp pilus assembly protein CpaB|nr:Flp pilus assembly protein CpaB [Planctomycetaceae bacterium]